MIYEQNKEVELIECISCNEFVESHITATLHTNTVCSICFDSYKEVFEELQSLWAYVSMFKKKKTGSKALFTCKQASQKWISEKFNKEVKINNLNLEDSKKAIDFFNELIAGNSELEKFVEYKFKNKRVFNNCKK